MNPFERVGAWILDRFGLQSSRAVREPDTGLGHVIQLTLAPPWEDTQDQSGGGDDGYLNQRASDVEAVRRVWRSMPERSRRILELRFMYGMTELDIAKQWGVSERYVFKMIYRVKTRVLRELRRGADFDPDRPRPSGTATMEIPQATQRTDAVAGRRGRRTLDG